MSIVACISVSSWMTDIPYTTGGFEMIWLRPSKKFTRISPEGLRSQIPVITEYTVYAQETLNMSSSSSTDNKSQKGIKMTTIERAIASFSKIINELKKSSKSPWIRSDADFYFVQYELIDRATNKIIDSGEEMVGPLYHEGQDVRHELQKILKRKLNIRDNGMWFLDKDLIISGRCYGKHSKKYRLRAKYLGSIDITGVKKPVPIV